MKSAKVVINAQKYAASRLTGVSLSVQGLWLRLQIVASLDGESGRLSLDGKPMSDSFLATKCGCSIRELYDGIRELVEIKALIVEDDGVICCPEVESQDKLSLMRKEAGKKGGNPVLLKQMVKQNDDENTNENIQLSENETVEKTKLSDKIERTPKVKKPAKEINIAFDQFWEGYKKKAGKNKSEEMWNKLTDSDRERIMAGLERYVSLPNHVKDERQFQPMATTFLNQRRFDDESYLPASAMKKPEQAKEEIDKKTLDKEYRMFFYKVSYLVAPPTFDQWLAMNRPTPDQYMESLQ